MKPAIGRIVHYYDGVSNEPIPVCVYGVGNDDSTVDLTLLIPGATGVGSVAENEPKENFRTDYWTWPPRE